MTSYELPMGSWHETPPKHLSGGTLKYYSDSSNIALMRSDTTPACRYEYLERAPFCLALVEFAQKHVWHAPGDDVKFPEGYHPFFVEQDWAYFAEESDDQATAILGKSCRRCFDGILEEQAEEQQRIKRVSTFFELEIPPYSKFDRGLPLGKISANTSPMSSQTFDTLSWDLRCAHCSARLRPNITTATLDQAFNAMGSCRARNLAPSVEDWYRFVICVDHITADDGARWERADTLFYALK